MGLTLPSTNIITMSSKDNNAYCYFQEIGFPPQKDLLDLWARSWANRGWNPVILTEDDAKKSSYYEYVLAAAKRLPTVNDPLYSQANYLRYCALHAVGGGLLTDYDVINYDLQPYHLDDIRKNRPFVRFHVGGFVWLNKVSVAFFCQAIMRMKSFMHETMTYDEKPHVSDVDVQEVFLGPPRYNLCAIYGEYNWDKFPTVHYSNDSLAGVSDKSFTIQALRPLI